MTVESYSLADKLKLNFSASKLQIVRFVS